MRRNPDDPVLHAQAGLRMSFGALLDGYPQAIREGRKDAWLKAVLAVAEYYAHIEASGKEGLRSSPPLGSNPNDAPPPSTPYPGTPPSEVNGQ